MAIDIEGNIPLSTKRNRKKTRFQLQISQCRTLLRRQAERIAGIEDEDTLEAPEIIITFEQQLFRLENRMVRAERKHAGPCFQDKN